VNVAVVLILLVLFFVGVGEEQEGIFVVARLG